VYIDRQGKIVDINKRVETILGYKREEIIGRYLSKLKTPKLKDISKFLKILKIVVKSGKVKDIMEFELINKDGHKIFAETYYKIVKRDGRLDGFLVVIRDVTKRKQIEENIKSEKEKFEKYLNIVGNILVALDSNGKVTLANKRCYEILGYREGELIGKDWFKTCLPKKYTKKVKEVFKKLMSGKVKLVEYYENPIITKKEEEKIIRWHNTILKDSKGEIIGILSSGEDVTEQKKIEEKLRKSEKRFREFFENARNVYFYMISPEGKILDINKAALKALGYKKKEIVGKPILTTLYHPSSRKKAKKLFLQWKRTGKIENEELKIVTKRGKERIVLLSTSAVRDENGKLLHSVSVQRDITEQKRAEEELKKARYALESKIRELENFTKFAVGRELKMIEMKKRIRELEEKLDNIRQTNKK